MGQIHHSTSMLKILLCFIPPFFLLLRYNKRNMTSEEKQAWEKREQKRMRKKGLFGFIRSNNVSLLDSLLLLHVTKIQFKFKVNLDLSLNYNFNFLIVSPYSWSKVAGSTNKSRRRCRTVRWRYVSGSRPQQEESLLERSYHCLLYITCYKVYPALCECQNTLIWAYSVLNLLTSHTFGWNSHWLKSGRLRKFNFLSKI